MAAFHVMGGGNKDFIYFSFSCYGKYIVTETKRKPALEPFPKVSYKSKMYAFGYEVLMAFIQFLVKVN